MSKMPGEVQMRTRYNAAKSEVSVETVEAPPGAPRFAGTVPVDYSADNFHEAAVRAVVGRPVKVLRIGMTPSGFLFAVAPEEASA